MNKILEGKIKAKIELISKSNLKASIQSPSVIMLGEKDFKNLVNKTHIKKTNYFYYKGMRLKVNNNMHENQIVVI
jgi:hypothetical protein